MSSETRTALFVVGAVACVKLLLFAWGAAQFDFAAHPEDDWTSIWNRWDASVYQTIATEGYRAPSVAPDYRAFLSHFPPLYPTLIAATARILFLTPNRAGMAISFISILGTTYILYRLALHDTGNRRTAVAAAFLLNLYPTSYFTVAPYTESLFLLLILVSVYWLRTEPRDTFIPGLAAAAAILTRLIGVALLPAYAWVLWKKYREGSLRAIDVSLVVLPLLAIAVYLGINAHYYGEPFFFLKEYATNPFSAKRTIFPLQETLLTTRALAQHLIGGTVTQGFMMTQGWNALFTVFALIVTIIGMRKKLPLEYSIYALSYILFFSSFFWGISNARYTLVVFPMFITFASIKHRAVQIVIGGAFFALLLYFSHIFTSGSWAF